MISRLLLVSIGNTRTRLALAQGDRLEPSQVFPNSDLSAIAVSACSLLHVGAQDTDPPTAIFASVNPPAAEALEAELTAKGVQVLKFGKDLVIPVVNSLTDDSTLGPDRLLDALGAFSRSSQACIVVDAGTAVTVDFIDGEGTFHGGAISPGLSMMLRALKEQTAALPLVSLTPDIVPHADADIAADKPPFGKDTRHAIAVGVISSIRGMVHTLIDRYAAYYKAYPRVVATGGDAPLLFEGDPLVEAIVPDLPLIGMLAAVRKLEEIDAHDGDSDPDPADGRAAAHG